MGNETVLALQKAEEAKRQTANAGGFFRKIADGDVLTLTKVGESDLVNSQFGPQAVYRVDDGKEVFRLGFKIGHPVIPQLEAIAVGKRFEISRTGKGKKDTKYTVKAL